MNICLKVSVYSPWVCVLFVYTPLLVCEAALLVNQHLAEPWTASHFPSPRTWPQHFGEPGQPSLLGPKDAMVSSVWVIMIEEFLRINLENNTRVTCEWKVSGIWQGMCSVHGKKFVEECHESSGPKRVHRAWTECGEAITKWWLVAYWLAHSAHIWKARSLNYQPGRDYLGKYLLTWYPLFTKQKMSGICLSWAVTSQSCLAGVEGNSAVFCVCVCVKDQKWSVLHLRKGKHVVLKIISNKYKCIGK